MIKKTIIAAAVLGVATLIYASPIKTNASTGLFELHDTTQPQPVPVELSVEQGNKISIPLAEVFNPFTPSDELQYMAVSKSGITATVDAASNSLICQVDPNTAPSDYPVSLTMSTRTGDWSPVTNKEISIQVYQKP